MIRAQFEKFLIKIISDRMQTGKDFGDATGRRNDTLVSYGLAIRMKIWIALCDQRALIGQGYRAHHAKILDELSQARNNGTQIKNPNGSPLNINLLAADDLYAFLGSPTEDLDGPQRKISNPKVRVLHAYIMHQMPYTASLIAEQSNIHDLAVANFRYTHGWHNDGRINKSKEFLQRISGIYISIRNDDYAREFLEGPQTELDKLFFYYNLFNNGVVAISIKFLANMPYCKFCHIRLPIERKDFAEISNIACALDQATENEKDCTERPVIINNGIGIIQEFTRNDTTVMLNVLYDSPYNDEDNYVTIRDDRPKVVQLFLDGYNDTSNLILGVSIVPYSEFYQVKNNKKGSILKVFSNSFFEKIIELHKRLNYTD